MNRVRGYLDNKHNLYTNHPFHFDISEVNKVLERFKHHDESRKFNQLGRLCKKVGFSNRIKK